MSTPQPSQGAPLSLQLREATRELHAHAERAGTMGALVRGEAERIEYARMLRALLAIYDALESGLRRRATHPTIAALPVAGLERTNALRADLLALAGADAPPIEPVAPAAASYAERLQAIAEREPVLLAAHVYVRYLGDLHGGQLLSRILARSLGLSAERGLGFYQFGDRATVLARVNALRTGLDACVHDDDDRARVVGEACDAFSRHIRLFEQLHANAHADASPSASAREATHLAVERRRAQG